MLSRCRATNAAGSPCSATPVRDSGFCYWHDPAIAAEREAARRRGGSSRSNRARLAKRLPEGALSLDELRGLIGATIKDVISGKLEPSIGNSVAALSRSYIAVAEASAVETLQAEVAELRLLIERRGLA